MSKLYSARTMQEGAEVPEGKWRQFLSAMAPKIGVDALFVYRLLPEGKLVRFFQFPPSGQESPFSLDPQDEIVREILSGGKALSGKSSRFGDVFSKFNCPYLAVFPMHHGSKPLGILAAGMKKKVSQTKLDCMSQEMSHLVFQLAILNLEEDKKTFLAQCHVLQKKLNSAYHRIVESDKLASLGRFAGGLAHELNTPLGAIQTYTEYLQFSVQGGAEKEALDGILRAISYCKEIIENVLRLSRDKKQFFEPVNLKNVVQDAMLLTSPEMEKHKICVIHELDPQICSVFGDHTQLVQVVTNLLVNARDAISRLRLIPRESVIKVSLCREKDDNVIIVADNGPGISEKVLGRIFDPFFTTKEIGSGTGLGLSICHAIIEEHKGSIEALSDEGKGTDIVVKIPIYNEVKPDVSALSCRR